jgi:ABC-type phosphate/phosphonate transport system substrate-binding protein
MIQQKPIQLLWTCEGKNTHRPHPEQLIRTPICPYCGSEAPAPASATSSLKRWLPWGLAALGVTALLVAGMRSFLSKPCPFKDCTLTIGVIYLPPLANLPQLSSDLSPMTDVPPLSTPSPAFSLPREVSPTELSTPSAGSLSSQAARFVPPSYAELKGYLEEQIKERFDQQLTVKLDSEIQIGTSQWIEKASQRLQSKQWDIAFTLSPLVAVDAKENGYDFAVRMMNRADLRMVFFINRDIPIEYVQDLTPNTRVALADKSDLPGFYLPIFDLYGEEVSIQLVPNIPNIVQAVSTGQADAGVGFEEMVKMNPRLKILKDRRTGVLWDGRSIPPGGVYLSPNLSEDSKRLIKELLLNASEEVQKKSAYVPSGEEGNYEEVKQIKTRAEELLGCINFQKNPVKLYCPETGAMP